MLFQIPDCRSDNSRAVLEISDSEVAFSAQQSANFPSGMTMINMCWRHRPSAYCTQSKLFLIQQIIFRKFKPIIVFEPAFLEVKFCKVWPVGARFSTHFPKALLASWKMGVLATPYYGIIFRKILVSFAASTPLHLDAPSFQITDCPDKKVTVLSKVSNPEVEILAEKSTNYLSFVTMVYKRRSGCNAADSAHTTLLMKKFRKLLLRNPVKTLEVIHPIGYAHSICVKAAILFSARAGTVFAFRFEFKSAPPEYRKEIACMLDDGTSWTSLNSFHDLEIYCWATNSRVYNSLNLICATDAGRSDSPTVTAPVGMKITPGFQDLALCANFIVRIVLWHLISFIDRCCMSAAMWQHDRTHPFYQEILA